MRRFFSSERRGIMVTKLAGASRNGRKASSPQARTSGTDGSDPAGNRAGAALISLSGGPLTTLSPQARHGKPDAEQNGVGEEALPPAGELTLCHQGAGSPVAASPARSKRAGACPVRAWAASSSTQDEASEDEDQTTMTQRAVSRTSSITCPNSLPPKGSSRSYFPFGTSSRGVSMTHHIDIGMRTR